MWYEWVEGVGSLDNIILFAKKVNKLVYKKIVISN